MGSQRPVLLKVTSQRLFYDEGGAAWALELACGHERRLEVDVVTTRGLACVPLPPRRLSCGFGCREAKR